MDKEKYTKNLIWTTIHIFTRTFNENVKNSTNPISCTEYKKYLKGFTHCLFRIVPYKNWSNAAFLWLCNNDLSNMDDYVNLWDWSCVFHLYMDDYERRKNGLGNVAACQYKLSTPQNQECKLTKEYLDLYYYPSKITKRTWGPIIWNVIHTFAYLTDSSPPSPNTKNSYKCIVTSLQWLLPCEECKEHIRNNLAKIHIDDPKYKNNFWAWSVDLHNYVNQFLKKPTISYEEAKQKFLFT